MLIKGKAHKFGDNIGPMISSRQNTLIRRMKNSRLKVYENMTLIL